MPKRIQMTRQRPWRADNPDAVIVTRPRVWGNPFLISPIVRDRTEARRLAVEAYRAWVTQSDLDPEEWNPDEIALHGRLKSALGTGELAGRDLACWCPLDQPCHADVLLDLANPADRPGEEVPA